MYVLDARFVLSRLIVNMLSPVEISCPSYSVRVTAARFYHTKDAAVR